MIKVHTKRGGCDYEFQVIIQITTSGKIQFVLYHGSMSMSVCSERMDISDTATEVASKFAEILEVLQ